MTKITEDGLEIYIPEYGSHLVTWDQLKDIGLERTTGKGMQKYMKMIETFDGDILMFKYGSMDSLIKSRAKERDNKWKYYQRDSDHRFIEIDLEEEEEECLYEY